MGGVCDTYGEKRNAYRVLEGKTIQKIVFGRPRGRWRKILVQMLQSWDEMAWAGLMWLKTRTSGRNFLIRL
jgi:hypothetical protein